MRRLRNILLEKYNAHNLDHVAGTKVISHEERPFGSDIGDFIIDHVRKCSELQRPRAAVFNDPRGRVARSCRTVLGHPSTFAVQSAQIAEELYAIMSRNRNIDPGILVVCLCRNKDENYRFLALLKMDPHSVFRASIGPNVDIVLEGKALPDPQRHLQKFALVRNPPDGAGPALLLQDMQASADEVANFFQNDFLGCTFCKDDTGRTKEFATTHRNWVNEKVGQGRVTPEEANRLMAAGDRALQAVQIVLDDFARSEIAEPELANDYMDYFAGKGVDTEFKVDHVAAGRYLREKRIRLDRGEIKIKEADLSDREYFQVDDDPDNPEYKVVRIRTRTYHYLN